MPLHEYLETKRRQNIRELNATGACHICGSSCRHSGGFSRLMAEDVAMEDDASEVANMRTCGCTGSTWPYSLRVCDMCIKDDAASLTGRVRHCGICGVVACDEDCGVELVECTDVESWNNAGCLECRKMEAFREIDIFKTPPPIAFPYISSTGEDETTPLPRMTRVCTKCLTSFTPWVKYDFVCRRFKCETRLVPSDIAERKRYCLLASSRSPLLTILPEDGIAAIVDFLGGDELCNLLCTSSSMCIVAERVARNRVEEAADQYPSGPICVSNRKCFRDIENPDDPRSVSDPRSEIRSWVYATNEHDFPLRAPDDAKTWTGVYHYMEKMTEENFYFGFQSHQDGGAVCRFIAQPLEEKFTFSGTIYSKVGQNLVREFAAPPGITVKGGQVGIFDETALVLKNMTFASNQLASVGGAPVGGEKQHFIGRLFCPGSGSLAPPTRDILGSVGFLRIHRNGRMADDDQGSDATWLSKVDILEGWLKDDSVFGFEYDPANRSLNVRTFGFSRLNRSQSTTVTLPAEDLTGDDVVLALELTQKAAMEHGLLSIRKCDTETWSRFLEHLPDETPVGPQAEEEAAAAEAVVMLEDADERDNGLRRIRRRVEHMRGVRRRQEHRQRLRAAAQVGVINVDDNNGENGNGAEAVRRGEEAFWEMAPLV